MTVFDTARVRRGATSSAQRAAAGPGAPRCGAEASGADRDEGRHGADRRRVDPGRPREGDPSPTARRASPRSDGLAIDLYLLHAPDPRTPWRTSVRALARLADDGLVRRVGRRNVNRRQLDEALELAPIAAVQVALSPFDDRALRGGVVERCAEAGIAVIAHSPLGGPRRAGGLARRRAARRGRGRTRRDPGRGRARVAARALAGGGRDPGRAASRDRALGRAARRGSSSTPGSAQRSLARSARRLGPRRAARPADDADVVRRHGHPGSREEPRRRGVRRARLPAPQPRRARRLAARARRRARRGAVGGRAAGRARQHVPHARGPQPRRSRPRGRHGAAARCIWLDTPLAQAQVNLVERLLDRFGSLPEPEELRGARPA